MRVIFEANRLSNYCGSEKGKCVIIKMRGICKIIKEENCIIYLLIWRIKIKDKGMNRTALSSIRIPYISFG